MQPQHDGRCVGDESGTPLAGNGPASYRSARQQRILRAWLEEAAAQVMGMAEVPAQVEKGAAQTTPRKDRFDLPRCDGPAPARSG
ncbi:hypothetical protein [Streptomyces sp. NPDC048419]|uniref:hypothetical protein n=1 Tax=Streptomyces sp. NPDC048419 TaxID=3365547 RepID=UPI00371C1E71